MSDITKAELAKLKKKDQLYTLFLDLWYSAGFYTNAIDDLNIEMKELKKGQKKSKKSLAEVKKRYEEVYGSPPLEPRKR